MCAHACCCGGREIERLKEELERAKANQATAQQEEETEDRQVQKKRANQKLAQDMEGWPRYVCACQRVCVRANGAGRSKVMLALVAKIDKVRIAQVGA